MKAIYEKQKKGILIIRPSALGDTLLLAPALYQVAHTAEPTVVGRKPGIDFLESCIREGLDYEQGGWHTIFSQKPICGDLPAIGFEKVVCFLTDPDGDALKGLGACFRDADVQCFKPFPSKEEKVHVACYLARCFSEAGLALNPEQAVEEAKRKPLLSTGRQQENSAYHIVLHPGSGSETKNYPLEFWLNLVHDIQITMPYKKILLLGPAERHYYERIKDVCRDSNTKISLCPQRNDLYSLLEAAALYVGHDSGITHLSALLGTPTIALFRNNRCDQWAPLGPDVTVLDHTRSYAAILDRITEKLRGACGIPDNQPRVLHVNRPSIE
ncbi:MAG: glycosyltransferase family 9 protein [Thermodesulfobacteriota bacterium]